MPIEILTCAVRVCMHERMLHVMCDGHPDTPKTLAQDQHTPTCASEQPKKTQQDMMSLKILSEMADTTITPSSGTPVDKLCSELHKTEQRLRRKLASLIFTSTAYIWAQTTRSFPQEGASFSSHTGTPTTETISGTVCHHRCSPITRLPACVTVLCFCDHNNMAVKMRF